VCLILLPTVLVDSVSFSYWFIGTLTLALWPSEL